MRRRKTGRITDKLAVLPFLLVCVLFVWFGGSELQPGIFRQVWVLLAAGITLSGWIAILRKPALSWKSSARVKDGTEADREDGGEAGPSADTGGVIMEDVLRAMEDPLMAEVDRILGLEGVLEARLESDVEQRERLEELRALYELRSISEEEYERKFREVLEERK